MSPTSTTLYAWTSDGVTLELAITAVTAERRSADDPAVQTPAMLANPVGLFYAPGHRGCRFGLVSEGKARDGNDTPLDLASVFEARLFTSQGELRWWNDPQRLDTGKACYLSEQDQGPPEGDHWTRNEPLSVEKLENQYLLWGQHWRPHARSAVNPPRAGWTILAAGRVGSLFVPYPGADTNAAPLGGDERLLLKTMEYLGPVPGAAGRHGNMLVIEERLLHLAPYRTSDEETGDE